MNEYIKVLEYIDNILSKEKKPLSKSEEVILYLNTTFKNKGSVIEAIYTLYESKSKYAHNKPIPEGFVEEFPNI